MSLVLNQILCHSYVAECHPEFISGSVSIFESQCVKCLDAETSLPGGRQVQHDS